MAFNETGNIDRLSENRRNSFNPDKVSDMKFNFTKQEGKTNFNKISDMKFNFNKKENNLGSEEKDKNISDERIEKKELKELLDDYIKDLKKNSDFPDTINSDYFADKKLEKISPEVNAQKREEFDDLKKDLKQQWEEKYGIPWPKYTEDVYSSNGKLIRQKGHDYDAHHIQPLNFGGKNVAENITPIHAEKHYDSQGVHSPTSPYSQIEKLLSNK